MFVTIAAKCQPSGVVCARKTQRSACTDAAAFPRGCRCIHLTSIGIRRHAWPIVLHTPPYFSAYSRIFQDTSFALCRGTRRAARAPPRWRRVKSNLTQRKGVTPDAAANAQRKAETPDAAAAKKRRARTARTGASRLLDWALRFWQRRPHGSSGPEPWKHACTAFLITRRARFDPVAGATY